MLGKSQTALLDAVTKLLKPLVSILLRYGIDYGTVAERLRKVYVEVAFEEGKSQSDKPPTISSVSAITGLTRKETKRLKELEQLNSETAYQRFNKTSRVISGWLNDKNYLSLRKKPKRLKIDNDPHSFKELVKKYSGDIPFRTMLALLQESNIVRCTEDYVELVQTAYIPEQDSLDKIDILGADVTELITTINHNLHTQKEALYFQRKVSNTRIKPEALPKFEQYAAKKSQRLLEELDSYLSKHEVMPGESEDTANYASVGIYYYDDSVADFRLRKDV